MIEGIYKCQYWDKKDGSGGFNGELIALLQSWFDYVIENFDALENGTYQNLRDRPVINYK